MQHERARAHEVLGCNRVVYGALYVAVLLEPLGGPGMQPGDCAWIQGLELTIQDGGEEMVVPVFGPGCIERNEEEVRAFDLGEHEPRVGALEYGVAQRRGEPLEHRGVRHEISEVTACCGDNISGEVIEDVARTSRELIDEVLWIGVLLDDDAGQTETREPTLCPLREFLDVSGCEANVDLPKEFGRLVGRDTEIPCSDLRRSPLARSRAIGKGGS